MNLPIDSNYFKVGGTLDARDPSYIPRAADQVVMDLIAAGQFVALLDSRQKGKSSLLSRCVASLRSDGNDVVKLDLQRMGANVTPEQWYAGLLFGIGEDLGLTKELAAFWKERPEIGPLARLLAAISTLVLPSTKKQLVIFVDEIDFVRALPFSVDEFFAGIRECYNRRAEERNFEKLVFCVAGVATPSQLIDNPVITPFNIGSTVNLDDFSLDELSGFAHILSTNNRSGKDLIGRVFFWVNGHPYLTQLLCREIADRPEISSRADLDKLVRQVFLSASNIQDLPNLCDVERRLTEVTLSGMPPEAAKEKVLHAYRQVLRNSLVDSREDDPVISTLKLSGVTTTTNGQLKIRNRVYSQVFDEKWRRSHLSTGERERQKSAALRAGISVGVIASAIIATVAFLSARNLSLANDRAQLLTQTKHLSDENAWQAYSMGLNLMDSDYRNQNYLRLMETFKKVSDFSKTGWELQRWNVLLNQSEMSKQLPPDTRIANLLPDGKWIYGGFTDQKGWVSEEESNQPSFSLDWALPVITATPPENFTRLSESLKSRIGPKDFLVPSASMGKLLVVRSPSKSQLNLITETGRMVLCQSKFSEGNGAAGISHDLKTVVTTDFDGRVRAFDAKTGKQLWSLPKTQITSIVFSPSDKVVAVSGFSEEILVADAKSGKVLQVLTGHKAPVSSLLFLGNELVSSSRDGSIRIWDVASGTAQHILLGHDDGVDRVCLTSDKRLVSTAQNSKAMVWNTNKLALQTSVDFAMPDEVHRIVQVDNETCVAASKDGSILSFSPITFRENARLQAVRQPDSAMIAVPNLSAVAYATNGRNLVVADARTLQKKFACPLSNQSAVSVITVGPEDSLLIGFFDGEIRRYFSNGTSRRVNTHGLRVRSIAMSKDGSKVASCSINGIFNIVDTKSWKVIFSDIRDSSIGLPNCNFSPDGRLISVTDNRNKITVFNLENGSKTVLSGHTSRVFGAWFSPDAEHLFSFGFDGTVRKWNVANGALLSTLRHGSWVASARPSPDFKRIVTACADKIVRIWDAEHGTLLMELEGQKEAIFDANFTSDGHHVISASNDKTVRIWLGRRPAKEADASGM